MLIFIIVFGGCFDQQRRANYVNNNPHTNSEIKKLILRGAIRNGMTKEEVKAARGVPWRITRASWGDTWRYDVYENTGTYFYFNNSDRVIGWYNY